MLSRYALPRHGQPPAAGRGYTLIEMLAVMLIMGLLLGLVTAIARPDARDRLQLEAERLAQLLNLAAAESQLTGKYIRWTADDTGYRFWRRQQDHWAELRDNDTLRPRLLPEGMRIADFRIETLAQPATMRLEFTPHGLPLAYQIGIAFGARRATITALPFGDAQTLDPAGPPDVTALR